MQHLSSLAKGLPAATLMPVLCLAGPAVESTPADSTRFRGSDGSGVSGAAATPRSRPFTFSVRVFSTVASVHPAPPSLSGARVMLGRHGRRAVTSQEDLERMTSATRNNHPTPQRSRRERPDARAEEGRRCGR